MRLRVVVGATVVMALLIAIPAALAAKPGNSPNAKICQKGGWQTLYTRDGTPFGSETQCASYGAQGGQIINETALACLDDGWEDLGLNSTTEFTSEQQCVDHAVGGGTLVTFADVRLGSTDSDGIMCGLPHNPATCESLDIRVYNDGPVTATVTVSLSGSYTEPYSNSSAGISQGNCTGTHDLDAKTYALTCTVNVLPGGGNTFLLRVFARNGASQVGTALITTSSVADSNKANDTFLWNFTAPVSLIGNRAWADTNFNGIQEAGEPGLAGATFLLRASATGALVAIAVSDPSGEYWFSSVPTGSYYVEVVAPSGYLLTQQDAGGDDALDSDFEPGPSSTSVFTHTHPLLNSTIDAGFVQLG